MAEMIPPKKRMQREQVPMPEQKPKERICNFKEVPLGYTQEQAIYEAQRCLQVCVLEKQGKPIAIGRLERFVADWARENNIHGKLPKMSKREQKVAIVGSGPAGLTCAADLAKLGYEVTIFEALHQPGGVLVYGIPEFRLPKSIVEYEVKEIEKLGVKVITNFVVGATRSVDELTREFDAIFLANGAE